jgi:ATP-dependent Zn protease
MTNGKSKKPAPPRPGPDPRGEKKPPLPSYRRGPLSWLIIAVVVFTALMMLKQWRSIENINYDDFERYIRNNEIESVEIGETEITGKFNQKGIDARAEKASISFAVDYNPDVVGDRLTTLLADSDVKWKFAKQHIWLPFLVPAGCSCLLDEANIEYKAKTASRLHLRTSLVSKKQRKKWLR